MQPPTDETPWTPVETHGLWLIEAEEQVTKEVAFHVVREPGGRPAYYARRLDEAIDYIADRDIDRCLLDAAEWRVLLFFDIDGSHVPPRED